MRSSLIISCGLLISSSWLPAADNNWANWRGPNYNGALEEANPPTSWSADQNICWKVEVPGNGKSTPIIWEDRIYLISAIETYKPGPKAAAAGQSPPTAPPGRGGRGGMNNPQPTNIYQFVVLAYDRHDGHEVWRTIVHEAVPHEAGHSTNSFASSSPITDGKHLFVSFGSQGVYCLDMNGKQIWSRDLGQMQTRNAFGEGGSPALHGDTLVVPWDHEGPSSLIALDARSGATKWRTDRDERTTWATPLIVEHAGKTQVVTNGTTVRSYDLADGRLLWECGGQVTNPIPCPIRLADSVICMTGYQGNAIYAISLDATGDARDSDFVRWHSNDAAPYVASPTLYKGRLYFTKSRDGIMSSVIADSGEVGIPQTRIPEIRDMYASLVAAADRIYCTSREGVTTVIKHGDQFEVLSVNKLGEPVDASPAIVGNRMYIRGAEHLFCIGEQ
jgi:outer membrane protein assembly factor BamB